MGKRRFQDWLGDQPIGRKLNLIFATLIVVPLVLFGAVISVVTRDMQLEQIQKSSRQYLKQSMQGIENTLSELDSIVVSNLWNRDMMRILNAIHGYVSSPEEKNTVRNQLQNIANTRKDIECLALVSDSGESFTYPGGDVYERFRPYISRQQPEWEGVYDEMYNRGETVWRGLPELPDYVVGVRRIRDFDTLEDLGCLYIFFEEGAIEQQYAELKITPGSFFALWDREGGLVSCDGEDALLPENAAKCQDGFIEIRGSGYYMKSLQNKELAWTLQEFTPRREMMREIYRVQLIFASVILMILGILILLLDRFSRSITQPIHNLQEKMQQVRSENFDVTARVEHKDEMGELTATFNAMTCRIKNLIEKDYQSKILLQEAEYKFLRAQINPHFLYNTLDSISWMASLNGNREVSRMAVALGRILRWSVSSTDNRVPLEEEISIVEDYLSIQKLRYGESLYCQVEAEDAALPVHIPKMTLQPLVENALIHGLEAREGEKRLSVAAWVSNGILAVSIRDNGVGIPPEKIEEIMGGKIIQEKNHGVGLYNVHQRIRLCYGNPYGLSIESIPGVGTAVCVTIPEEGMEQE